MTDLHTHILPGIDDGAASVEEAVHLIESLYLQNVKKAACTPHFNPTWSSLDDFLLKRKSALEMLEDTKIKLYPGSETRLNEYLFHYPDLHELCIGNTKYMLIELPFEKSWNEKYLDTLEKIINYYNIQPIIAHIERYNYIDSKTIKKLKNIGCTIQVNTGSIIDKKNNRKVLHLIKDNLVDVLSSDCHNMEERIPVFTEALTILSKHLGEYTCKKLDYNSECIIEGIRIRKKTDYIINILK
jgi:protein-tyrosine phosphatase